MSLFEMVTTAIKENFGCEKWAGLPHLLKCITPMSNWSCATCDQKTNAICGVSGILGGEVLMAWFEGRAINLGAKIASKGASTILKVNESLLLAEIVIASQASQRILNFVKNSAALVAKLTVKLVTIKPIVLTIKTIKNS